MKITTNYGIRVLAIGVMVLVFFAIPLYWGRFFADLLISARMPPEARRIEISPSRMLPEAIENDPNADRPSRAVAEMDPRALSYTLGVSHYVLSWLPGGERSDVFYYSRGGAWMYFDRSSGQIVFRDTHREEREGRLPVERQTPTHYAGPEGVSQTPDENLGRFRDPVPVPAGAGRHILYDRKLHRFFAINREAMTVTAGPEPDATGLRRPLTFRSESLGPSLYWQPPSERVLEESQEEGAWPRYRRRYTVRFATNGYWSRYLPVIDAAGRIEVLDQQTLEFLEGAAPKGFLPEPKTLYGRGSRRPEQLLDHRVQTIEIGPDHEYAGLIAAGVSRQGTAMAMGVFDANGVLVSSGLTRAMPYSQKAQIANARLSSDDAVPDLSPRQSPWMSSARAALFQVPWSPALTLFRYSLENVHPPILTVASFFVAPRTDAGASHRTLFLVPNSFAAMQRDLTDQNFISQFFGAMVIILPGILLAVFLAWRVVRDAAVLGLSKGARSLWLLGTLAFGLPAYITYRMTRPAAGLVTCVNCGRARRSDRQRCHLCGSPWETPELAPLAWRVLDEGAEPCEPSAESEKSCEAGEQNTDSSVEMM